MRRKGIALLLAALMMYAGCAVADDWAETQWTREQARQRNMTLISEAQARSIAARQFGDRKPLRFKEIELENEADDYPDGTDFRPVYKLECRLDGTEYDVDIDAVTGQVLKFKVDD